jgi:hypothetical protein
MGVRTKVWERRGMSTSSRGCEKFKSKSKEGVRCLPPGGPVASAAASPLLIAPQLHCFTLFGHYLHTHRISLGRQSVRAQSVCVQVITEWRQSMEPSAACCDRKPARAGGYANGADFDNLGTPGCAAGRPANCFRGVFHGTQAVAACLARQARPEVHGADVRQQFLTVFVCLIFWGLLVPAVTEERGCECQPRRWWHITWNHHQEQLAEASRAIQEFQNC